MVSLQSALTEVKPLSPSSPLALASAGPADVMPAWGYLDPTPAHASARLRLSALLSALTSPQAVSNSNLFVLVQGPPGCGKTLDIMNLLRP